MTYGRGKDNEEIKSGWDTGWNTSSVDWDILHRLRNRRGGTCDKFRWNKLCLSCLKIRIWQCPLIIIHVSLELRRAMLTWNILEGQSRQMAVGALMVEKLTENGAERTLMSRQWGRNKTLCQGLLGRQNLKHLRLSKSRQVQHGNLRRAVASSKTQVALSP